MERGRNTHLLCQIIIHNKVDGMRDAGHFVERQVVVFLKKSSNVTLLMPSPRAAKPVATKVSLEVVHNLSLRIDAVENLC